MRQEDVTTVISRSRPTIEGVKFCLCLHVGSHTLEGGGCAESEEAQRAVERAPRGSWLTATNY